jgi:hypothetical protein
MSRPFNVHLLFLHVAAHPVKLAQNWKTGACHGRQSRDGYGYKAVAESRERVRAALNASGLAMPAKRITVNLAPADLPKEGSHYDLPIALGIMAAIGAIPPDALSNYTVLGELALDGTITPVVGVLPAAIAANGRGHGLICPHASGAEAALASQEIDVLAPLSLIQLVNHFKGTQVMARPRPAVGKWERSPICVTSRARKAPSGHSKSPRPGAQSLVERTARRWKIDARRAPSFDFAAAYPA